MVPAELRPRLHRQRGGHLFRTRPQIPRGIELYKGRPIFYSLGNFVLQQEMMTRQPAEFYARRDLGDDATTEDVYGTNLPREKYQYESFVAKISFANHALHRIELIPIYLQIDKPKGMRGTPILAAREQGNSILEKLAEISAPFNTKVSFDGDYGSVQLE